MKITTPLIVKILIASVAATATITTSGLIFSQSAIMASKPSVNRLRDLDAQSKARLESNTQAWEPIQKAIDSNSIHDLDEQVKAYVASGHKFRGDAAIAKMYLDHGYTEKARNMVDGIVIHNHQEMLAMKSRQAMFGLPVSEANACLLWLQFNPAASKDERKNLVAAWAEGYRSHMKQGIPIQSWPDLALLEFASAKEYEGNMRTASLAAEGYLRAFELVPESTELGNLAAYSLKYGGKADEAKDVAVRMARETADSTRLYVLKRDFGITDTEIKAGRP